jgi:hypothetical protein
MKLLLKHVQLLHKNPSWSAAKCKSVSQRIARSLKRSSAIVYNGEIDACLSMWERKWEAQTLA